MSKVTIWLVWWLELQKWMWTLYGTACKFIQYLITIIFLTLVSTIQTEFGSDNDADCASINTFLWEKLYSLKMKISFISFGHPQFIIIIMIHNLRLHWINCFQKSEFIEMGGVNKTLAKKSKRIYHCNQCNINNNISVCFCSDLDFFFSA